MKKISLFSTLLVAGLLLTGCNKTCNCNVPSCEWWEGQVNEAKAICIENKWTYSWITAPDREYWECMFPSWIGCEDDLVLAWECNWQPDIDDIDTEEERFESCKERVTGWVADMIDWAELDDVEYWDEEEVKDEEWNLSMIKRPFKAKYTHDWEKWILDWECEADFVQWGLGASFGEEYLAE